MRFRTGVVVTLSKTARRAQSRLANAAKAGAPEADLNHLRSAFAVERALDALRSIPGAISPDQRSALHAVVEALPRRERAGEQS